MEAEVLIRSCCKLMAVALLLGASGSAQAQTVRMASFHTERPALTQLMFDPSDGGMPDAVRYGSESDSQIASGEYRPVAWIEVEGCGSRTWRSSGGALDRLPAGTVQLFRVSSPVQRGGQCRIDRLRLVIWILSSPDGGAQLFQTLWQVSFDAAGRARLEEIGGLAQARALAARADAAPDPGWRSGLPIRLERTSTWRPNIFPRFLEIQFEVVGRPHGRRIYRPSFLAVSGCGGAGIVVPRATFAQVEGEFYWTQKAAIADDGPCQVTNTRVMFAQARPDRQNRADDVWEVRFDQGPQPVVLRPDAGPD